MRLVRALMVLITVAGAGWPVCAQRYSFKDYTPDQGLKNLVTRALVQDHSGLIWVGTLNGLFWYDGKAFHEFASDELPTRDIQALYESPSGTLWIGTRLGLARRVGTHVERVPSEEIQVMTEGSLIGDRQDRLYVATPRGLVRISVRDGHYDFQWLSREPTQGVGTGPEGKIWFGCGARLCRLDDDHPVDVSSKYGLPDEHWQSIISDREKNLWIRGTSRLFELKKGSLEFSARDKDLPPFGWPSGKLALSADGTVLVPTSTGLAIPVGDRWLIINADHGLSSDAVCCVLLDNENSLWIGLRGTGVARWLGYGQWESFTKTEGLSSNLIWEVTQDAHGKLWVGTDYVLNRIDKKDGLWRVWHEPKGKTSTKIKALAIGPDGDVWAGQYPGGVSRYREGKLRAHYGVESGLISEGIWGMYLDPTNHLWVGTTGALYRSSPIQDPSGRLEFTPVSVPGSSSSETFYRPMMDRHGRLWVPGTNGLACFEDGQWKRYGVPDGLSSNVVLGIAEADDGSYWIAYAVPQGVTHMTLAGGKLRTEHYTRKNGMRSDKTYFVAIGRSGSVWVGTDSGVDVFLQGNWQHYGRAEGLVWEDTDTDSFWAGPDGDVWIGTSHGLSHFQPARNPLPEVAPRVALTSIQFGGTDTKWGILEPRSEGYTSPLTVRYSDRSATIRFAALTFLHEDEVRLRYRLKNFDDRWTETQQREVQYLSIPPGTYVFEVMASAPGGGWSSAREFSFSVAPPFWETVWFRALSVVALGLVALGLWKWRMMRILDQQIQLKKEVQLSTSGLRAANLELESARKSAEAANTAKSQFLANVSHEIRTPMNGILGMTDLALGSDLTSEQQEFWSLVKASGDALLVVINDLLDYSKAEAGKVVLDPSPFDLPCLIDATMKALAGSAQQKGLRLVFHIQDGLRSTLLGDAGRLRQVITNLIGNAIKFTEKGEVTLTVYSAWTKEEETCLQFSVNDTGIGIPEGKLQSIFAPFEQVDSSTTRRFGGTGLGLAICSRIVELMGGKIWVESKLGVGSTFHFTACFQQAESADVPRSEARIMNGRIAPLKDTPSRGSRITRIPLHILVAEDNRVNQRLIIALLQKMGHAPVLAENGKATIEALQESGFDLILMDVQMPIMDGLEATSAIRAAENGTRDHIPIIAMTAHAMQGDREMCLAAGMDGYLSKPISRDELIRLLDSVVAANLENSTSSGD